MPDGKFPGQSDYNQIFGYGSYAEKPKPVEKLRPKEKDPKNFFEQKRNAWMDAMNDQKTASEIAQSIRGVMFAIPEGKTPRTEEETHAIYEDLEKLVRAEMTRMRLPGVYGKDLRFASFPSYLKERLFVFIDQLIPSNFLDNPTQDVKSLATIVSAEPESSLSRLEQKRRILHSSDRLAKFAEAVSAIFEDAPLDQGPMNRFFEAFEAAYEAPYRSYGFHSRWSPDDDASKERERAYQKELAEFQEQIKDDAFFDTTLDTIKQILLHEDGWSGEQAYSQFIYMSRTDRVEFLRVAPQFSEKGIDTLFLLKNQPFFKKADPSKEGFDMFQTREEKKMWLGQCLQAVLQVNNSSDQPFVEFVKDALVNPVLDQKKQTTIGSTQLKGISPRMAGEIDEDLDEGLDSSSPEVREAKYLQTHAKESLKNKLNGAVGGGYIYVSTFQKIEKLFGETGQEMIREFDQTSSHLIKDENLNNVVRFVGDAEVQRLLPNFHKQVVARIIEKVGVDTSVGESVARNFSFFLERPDAEALARKLSESLSTAQALYKSFLFGTLKPWQKDLMTEMETLYTSAVLNPPPPKSRSRGSGQTFLDSDPFEKHPQKYAGSSMRLGDVMSGKKTPEEVGLDLKPENVEFLREVNRVLDAEHQAFLQEVDASALIPPEDKIAYMNPSESLVKMNDIKDSIRTFLARYLAQSVVKRADRLTSKTFSLPLLENMIRDGYAKFLDVYATDIPLYDKLYDEFDSLRESGRSPLEVYLGRDGIYAYIGRKAQDATRKAVLGKEKVEGLRAEGEIVAIEPKYLVYPSYVRDYVDTGTKQEYLTYSGVTKDSDPLFYDTGYSGSIPQQIMEIMGFDRAQIEERIRLLSAPTDARRMRGIPASAKGEVIEKIENNPKSEQTASGLVKNPETKRITHSAAPASPEYQFKFSLIRQAIARHYLIQEKLHYEVPENTILDSEKFTLRIRSEYAEKLPDTFKANPIQFLEAQGTPEDGAVLMTLTDGTEVMARRVEWTKTKQAQTEYAILISAKKAGVPAAEPVGFVTGKSAEDESVILSKKIEGVPGKRFEKSLRESGKYSEDKIAELMRNLQGQIEAVTNLLKQTLNITGNWKVNDVAVQFNEETGVIERVIPLKWEQVKRRDEEKERRVRELIKDTGHRDEDEDD